MTIPWPSDLDELKASVLAARSAKGEALESFMHSELACILESVAMNPHTTAEQLTVLARSFRFPTVRAAALQHPNCGIDDLVRGTRSHSIFEVFAVIHNPATPVCLIAWLALCGAWPSMASNEATLELSRRGIDHTKLKLADVEAQVDPLYIAADKEHDAENLREKQQRDLAARKRRASARRARAKGMAPKGSL